MNGERIPTLPQMDERIATLPQSEGVGEGLFSDIYEEMQTEEAAFGVEVLLRSDVSFVGSTGTVYEIKAKQVISYVSGESQIYGCTAADTAEKLVARVLKSVTPDSSAEKKNARQKVIQFLKRTSSRTDSHILPLIDDGIVIINDRSFFVEVYPYCEEGDLERQKGYITYQMLCDKIIPGINEALHTFHAAGFVHRDVKPDNLYWYNGRIVLGDFGITCDLRSDGFATDRTKTGTLGYYAPELMSQAALIASDYYSFGQTIWTLYSGEMMYQNILRRYHVRGAEEQRNQINYSMMNGLYYGLDEIKSEDRFLEILIRGLLQYDPASRFDYNKVNRWLMGDKSLAHEISQYEDLTVYRRPFKYHGHVCWDNVQLYELLKTDWEEAKNLLYTGKLKEFFLSHDYDMANRIDQIMHKYASAKDDAEYDIGLTQLCLLLNKGKELCWHGQGYKSIEELSVYAPLDLEKMKPLLASGILKDWCEEQGDDEPYDLKLIEEMQSLMKSNYEFREKVAFEILKVHFSSRQKVAQYNGCTDITDVVNTLCEISKDRYSYILNTYIRSARFCAFLYSRKYFEAAHKRAESKIAEHILIESFYDFLDQQLDNKKLQKKLAEYYMVNGPKGYLFWFKNHLDLYEFNGAEARELRTEIENVTITADTLKDVRGSLNKLRELLIRFRKLFVGNIYMARLGVTDGKEKDGITSKHLQAYWHKNLFENDVPIGYDIR